MQELTELFASPPRPEKCPSLPSSSLSSSRTASTPPCLLVCGLFSAQSYQPFGAHWWSTTFTFLFDRHILFLWIPLTLIFASWTFFILLFFYFSQSGWRSFCIQTDFSSHLSLSFIASLLLSFVVIFIFFNFVFFIIDGRPAADTVDEGPSP